MDSESCKRPGTRIFKKSTPNGKLTVYLGKRDFIDHITHVDAIEGVVLVDPEYVNVKDRKVFVTLEGSFRYGRADIDLIIGFNFVKDFYTKTIEIYPNNSILGEQKDGEPPQEGQITRLQSRLLRKLGSNAYPFLFELPCHSPSSVTLVVNSLEGVKPCGVAYELKVFVADNKEATAHKRNSVRMAIRKLTYAPSIDGPQPMTEVSRVFFRSPGTLRVEATLDKEKYYHGEEIAVNLTVDNNSNKTIRRIKISVRQYVNLYMHSPSCYKCTVAEITSDDCIQSNRTGVCKEYRLKPLLAANRDKCGLALDGDLKNEDTNLASSTINQKLDGQGSGELVGIVVSYKMKIRLALGFPMSDVCLELPFILTHPNPEDLNNDLDNSSNLELEMFDLARLAPTESSDVECAPIGSVLEDVKTNGAAKTDDYDLLINFFNTKNSASHETNRANGDHAAVASEQTAINLFDPYAVTVPRVVNSSHLDPHLSSSSSLTGPATANNNNNNNNNNCPKSMGRLLFDPPIISATAPVTATASTDARVTNASQPASDENDMIFADFARLRMKNFATSAEIS